MSKVNRAGENLNKHTKNSEPITTHYKMYAQNLLDTQDIRYLGLKNQSDYRSMDMNSLRLNLEY